MRERKQTGSQPQGRQRRAAQMVLVRSSLSPASNPMPEYIGTFSVKPDRLPSCDEPGKFPVQQEKESTDRHNPHQGGENVPDRPFGQQQRYECEDEPHNNRRGDPTVPPHGRPAIVVSSYQKPAPLLDCGKIGEQRP